MKFSNSLKFIAVSLSFCTLAGAVTSADVSIRADQYNYAENLIAGDFKLSLSQFDYDSSDYVADMKVEIAEKTIRIKMSDWKRNCTSKYSKQWKQSCIENNPEKIKHNHFDITLERRATDAYGYNLFYNGQEAGTFGAKGSTGFIGYYAWAHLHLGIFGSSVGHILDSIDISDQTNEAPENIRPNHSRNCRVKFHHFYGRGGTDR